MSESRYPGDVSPVVLEALKACKRGDALKALEAKKLQYGLINKNGGIHFGVIDNVDGSSHSSSADLSDEL